VTPELASRPQLLLLRSPGGNEISSAPLTQQNHSFVSVDNLAAAVEIVRRVFAAIGRKTVWLGEAGKGSQVKLVVNAYMSILVE
jgi:3-hydroxyisobutyrate dehydrogenase